MSLYVIHVYIFPLKRKLKFGSLDPKHKCLYWLGKTKELALCSNNFRADCLCKWLLKWFLYILYDFLNDSLIFVDDSLSDSLLTVNEQCSCLTSKHDVISEKRHSEPEGQHEQVWGEAREQPGKLWCFRTEIPKCTGHQNSMRVKSKEIVTFRVQILCLHQLQRDRQR